MGIRYSGAIKRVQLRQITTSEDSPPVWITASGVVASADENTSISVNLVATDVFNREITYTLADGNLPLGVSMLSNGYVSGVLPFVTSNTAYSFDVNATTVVGTATRTFEIENLNQLAAPVWVTSAGQIASAEEQSFIEIQLEATDPQDREISYVLSLGTLPSGVTLSNSGLISGTLPDVVSNTVSNFTVTAVNEDASTARAFSIQNLFVTPPVDPPVWNTNAGVIATADEATAVTVQLSATDPQGNAVTYSLNGGSLPSGVTLYSNGSVRGTMPRIGSTTTFTFGVKATSTGGAVSRTFQLVDTNIPTLPVWSTPSGSLGPINERAGYHKQIIATHIDGLPVTYSLISGELPPNVTLSADGYIDSHPSVGGVANTTTFNYVINAVTTDGAVSRAFSTQVYNTPVAPVWQTYAGQLGVFWEKDPSIHLQLDAYHPDIPPVYTLSNGTTLPDGLSLLANGLVTGSLPPNYQGAQYDFTVKAENSDGLAYRSFYIIAYDVSGQVTWTTPAGNIADQAERSNVSVTVQAADANSYAVVYTITNGALPSGLTLNANTGLISGTLPGVTANTTSSFTVHAESVDAAADRGFTIITRNVPTAPVWVTNATLTSRNEGASVSQSLVATGADGIAVTYSLVNASTLPGTLALSNAGLISGTAPRLTANTGYEFDVRANSAEGFSDRHFSLTILNVPAVPTWVTNSGTIFTGNENSVVTANVVATGSDGIAVTYGVNSALLPAGVSMNNSGVFTGTLPLVGANTTSTFVVRADSAEGFSDRTFSIVDLNINHEPQWITPAGSLGTFGANTVVNYSLNATDVDAETITYTINTGALPGGLSLLSNGLITGTANAVGNSTTSNFVVNAADASAANTRAFSMTITAGDTYWANTVMLLKGEQSPIIDSTGKQTMNVASSGFTYSTVQKKYGTGSLNGPGVINREPLQTQFNPPGAQLGTKDFTIESWFYSTSLPNSQRRLGIVGLRTATFSSNAFAAFQFSLGGAVVGGPITNIAWDTYDGNSNTPTANYSNAVVLGSPLAMNTWHHVAAVRSGTTLKMYVNGNAVANTITLGSYSFFYDVNQRWEIGGICAGTQYSANLNGYMDDVRITVGTARYTANFTPPDSLPPF